MFLCVDLEGPQFTFLYADEKYLTFMGLDYKMTVFEED